MTTEEIEVIINSDLPSYQKSKLIEQLFAKKNESVKVCKEGGKPELILPHKEHIIDVVNGQEANFVQRLKDPNRKKINNSDGSVSTHKLAWAEVDNKIIIYPEIQEINGELVDLSNDRDKALKSALANNDYVEMQSPEEAEWFTTHYKEYYPGFNKYKEGGSTPEPDEEITIGDKKYQVSIADTEKERRIGLSKCTDLPKDEGMLFVFDEPVNQYFTMKETSIDLDIIFIDEEGVVISVNSVKARTEDPVVCEHKYKYVLEVNIDSGIEVGDELDQEDLDFTDEEKEQVKKSKMLVLNSEGDVQMKLVGGERIVSMIKTRQLIKAALKAYKTDSDIDYRRVGRIVMKEFDQQDQRDPQYVQKD